MTEAIFSGVTSCIGEFSKDQLIL